MLIEESEHGLVARGDQTAKRSSYTWADLVARCTPKRCFDEAFIMRVLEAALDRDAYSTTVLAVAVVARG
jgi:hypothetical protein